MAVRLTLVFPDGTRLQDSWEIVPRLGDTLYRSGRLYPVIEVIWGSTRGEDGQHHASVQLGHATKVG